jgi:hypothetical protein
VSVNYCIYIPAMAHSYKTVISSPHWLMVSRILLYLSLLEGRNCRPSYLMRRMRWTGALWCCVTQWLVGWRVGQGNRNLWSSCGTCCFSAEWLLTDIGTFPGWFVSGLLMPAFNLSWVWRSVLRWCVGVEVRSAVWKAIRTSSWSQALHEKRRIIAQTL